MGYSLVVKYSRKTQYSKRAAMVVKNVHVNADGDNERVARLKTLIDYIAKGKRVHSIERN